MKLIPLVACAALALAGCATTSGSGGYASNVPVKTTFSPGLAGTVGSPGGPVSTQSVDMGASQ